MSYETLLIEAEKKHIEVHEIDLKGKIKGLYKDGFVWIRRSLPTNEKRCVLAEEIGHYETSTGNILDQKDVQNRKQELRARQWAYFDLIPLSAIVRAHEARVKGRYEIASYLSVTEDFLQAAIDRYRDKYGLFVPYGKKHLIYFDPLGVVEMFEDLSAEKASSSCQ